MSDHRDQETPGIAGAIAEINRRFCEAGHRHTCPFVPSANYHICYQCGKTRDEHLAGKSTFTVGGQS